MPRNARGKGTRHSVHMHNGWLPPCLAGLLGLQLAVRQPINVLLALRAVGGSGLTGGRQC